MQAADQAVYAALDVSADIYTVWRAWTDPAWLIGWLPEAAAGSMAPGGALSWRWASLGVELDLEVVAFEPPRHLALRGGAPGRPPQVQSVGLTEVAGGTRVELSHAGFAPGPAGADEAAGSAAGWRVMLRVLAHYLAGRTGRRRECAAVLAPIAAPLGAVGELLHDPDRRAAWLGAGAELAAEGDAFELRAGGSSVSGRVLALAPPYELALGWDEIDGVLVLRAIQAAPGAAGPVIACAHAWSWSPERAAWRSARAVLEAAVAALVRAAGGPPAGSA